MNDDKYYLQRKCSNENWIFQAIDALGLNTINQKLYVLMMVIPLGRFFRLRNRQLYLKNVCG